jgi:hypothetical protein
MDRPSFNTKDQLTQKSGKNAPQVVTISPESLRAPEPRLLCSCCGKVLLCESNFPDNKATDFGKVGLIVT